MTCLQELPLCSATKATGAFVWKEQLHIDHLYQDTVLNSQTGALLLFEVLQYPKSMKQWKKNHKSFAGATHRVAWAFLDLAHPRTQKTTSSAWQSGNPAVVDVQMHPCDPYGLVGLQLLHPLLQSLVLLLPECQDRPAG